MNIDLPSWVSHEGQSIYSIDVDSSGKRVATAGSDAKVKIWSLLPLLSSAAEAEEKQHPRELATLSEHTAPVNTVRFSKNGKLLATCSDDKIVNIFQLQPGPGKAIFGSPPSLENWRLTLSLRGHSNNVIDVAWSPDDSLLASCSLDNTVIIWSATGRQVAVLEGHESYVKGISWDPVGSYLASQSDDKSVILWRCSDWSRLGRITAPFERGYTSQTFSLRLDWTPDGQHIIAANSYQSPSHTACVIQREDMSGSGLSIVGHKAPVTVICCSPLLLRDDSGDPACCFALGSQDQKVTVWVTNGMRPRVVLSKLFQQSVTDLAWTADGLTLLACSTDGRVSVARSSAWLQFEPGSLGQPLSPAESRAYISRLYGDKPRSKVLLAESAAQLELEQRAPKADPASRSGSRQVLQPAAANHQPSTSGLPARAGKPPEKSSKGVSARLGGATSTGFQTSGGAALPNGTPDRAEFPVPAAKSLARASARGVSVGQKRTTPASQTVVRPAKSPRRVSMETAGEAGIGTPLPNGTGHQGLKPAGVGYRALQSSPPVKRAFTISLGAEELPGGATSQVQLDIINTGSTAQLVCICGGKVLWRDGFASNVAKAAGNKHFASVALQDGSLHIYSRAGRQSLPNIRLSQTPAFLESSPDGWRLMAILRDGAVRLWDLQKHTLIVGTHLPPSHGADVASARLTQNGNPLVLLTDGSAQMLHLQLQEWVSLVLPSSADLPLACKLPTANAGELGRIEADADTAAGPSQPTAGLLHSGTPNDSIRHLETRLSAALLLESPAEYRRWLMTYVRHLAGAQDEGILKELCEELLGPIRSPAEGTGNSKLWERTVLGLDKRALLKEVLREVARHRTHPQLISMFTDLQQAAEEESHN